MAEGILDTRNRSGVTGLSSLTAISGQFNLNTTFDNSIVNVGTTPMSLVDPRTQEIKLLEQREIRNANEGIECELMINQAVELYYEVDVTGEVYLTDLDSDQYEIDGNSELIYNFQ